MTLEDLVYQRLTSADTITKQLAKYHDRPAITYQSAPEDTAEGWKSERQYPRIDYTVDMRANPERQTNGVLTLNIWCSQMDIPPEILEPEVRAVLQDIFIQPDDAPPFSLAWARSDAFEYKSEANPATLVVGISMAFDVFAFPAQATVAPDPIAAIQEYVKAWHPTVFVIGKDAIKRFLSPTEKQPIAYFRLANLNSYQETNTVVWLDGTLIGHVFAPENSRMMWLKTLSDSLAIDGEIILQDGSPMFLRGIKADNSVSPLSEGQLRLEVRFGILRRLRETDKLNHIHL